MKRIRSQKSRHKPHGWTPVAGLQPITVLKTPSLIDQMWEHTISEARRG